MEPKNFYYNITFKVDHNIEEAWKNFMKEEYLPEVNNTGLFTELSLNKILYVDNSEGITYAIQMATSNLSNLQKYFGTKAPELLDNLNKRFLNKFVSFASIMEIDCLIK